MAVMIGSARCDENGRISGGRAGDQTGREVSTQSWYRHKKGWRTFRPKSPVKAAVMAEAMGMLCADSLVGYDQYQRNTLYSALKAVGFESEKLGCAVETDCSALIRVCAACAGIFLPDFTTGNQPGTLLDSGEFIELKGSKYNDQSAFLRAGDVQVTCVRGHTVMVLTDGERCEAASDAAESVLGGRILRNGCSGGDVALMQRYLIELGCDLGVWGADGDFGDCTELAVMEFQKGHGCKADGEYGPETHAALMAALEVDDAVSGQSVRIDGGQCWVRTGSGTAAERLGVAARGSVWPYLGEVSDEGWLKIDYSGRAAWVSGRYGKVC